MSGADSSPTDEMLEELVGSNTTPSVNIEESGTTEITIKKFIRGADGHVEEMEVSLPDEDADTLREEVEADIMTRVEEAEPQPAPEPEPEPETVPEPEPEPETDDEPVGGVDFDPSDIDEDPLLELTGIGETTVDQIRAEGVTGRAELAESIESGGPAARHISSLWIKDVADALGVSPHDSLIGGGGDSGGDGPEPDDQPTGGSVQIDGFEFPPGTDFLLMQETDGSSQAAAMALQDALSDGTVIAAPIGSDFGELLLDPLDPPVQVPEHLTVAGGEVVRGDLETLLGEHA